MKTLKSISILSLLLLSIFFLETCKPEDEAGKTYGPYTLGEANDYLNFKPGSWWVYQHNKSGLYDTLVLKSISIRSQTFTGKNTVIKDMVNMLIYSTTTGYEYKYYTLPPNPDAKPEILKKIFFQFRHGKSKPGDYQGETVSFYYPFDLTQSGGGSPGESKYEGIDSILLIKGYYFNNVRRFRQEYDGCFSNKTAKYYWAKDVGLIKMGIPNTNEFWELINFKILKQ